MPDTVAANRRIPVNTVEIRRGPLGRWVPVPANSPRDIADIGAEGFALSGILDPILESHRVFKNTRYAAKKADPRYRGPHIVAEGDSWFEYPYNDDLVMILGEKYAIMSLAKAGDAWTDIYRKNELFPAIMQEHPDIVMLSLGGNEVMGQIENYVQQFELNRPASKYILPSFAKLLDWVENQYDTTIEHILAQGAQVIVHGYDYPDARAPATQGAQWIGPPLLNMRNIDGVAMWREIANIMLDRYNEMMARMVGKAGFAGRVHYVDLRGTIGNADYDTGPDPDLWCDEIHGSAAGFGKLAKKIDRKIKQIAAVA
ncbi:MAG: SGNH/GDSL hydrolase family protein [Deltaproteobacteria bacterium]|nr:SGNH/GDSL hydrolase family protein [Deltaproteobacteria bacterium]